MQNSHLTYTQLQQAQTPQLLTKKTNEQRFWRKYLAQQLQTQHAGFLVNSIAANHNDRDLMLFAHGRSVSLVDTKRSEIIRQFANFDASITSVTMRKDGAVMALGDEIGRIQVMDTKQKFRLRSFKNHKKRINCLQFQNMGGRDQYLYSAGEDMTLRQYDIAAGEVVSSYDKIHNDYIKCVKTLGNQTILTGAYDGQIKMFDLRSGSKPINCFSFEAQVQWFDLFPSNLSFIACGQKKIALWDIRKNQALNRHIAGKKMISCVRVGMDGSRILTSSLDQHLKVFKADTFQLTYQEKLEAPISTFDINKNNLCIGLGLQNKKMILKTRSTNKNCEDNQSQDEKQVEDEIAQWFNKNLETSKNKSSLNNKYFYRGIYEKPSSYQIMFERNQNKKISDYDKMLKKFQYKKAFLLSLRKKNMAIFIALIDEYTQRGCLDRTIKSFSQAETQEIFQRLSILISDVRYSPQAIMLLNKFIEFHSNKLDSEAAQSLKQVAQKEIQCISKMKQISGMLQLIQNNCL